MLIERHALSSVHTRMQLPKLVILTLEASNDAKHCHHSNAMFAVIVEQ